MPTRQIAPHRPGRPIGLPADFPVRWANPAQSRQCWFLDRVHFPDPLPPLLASLSHKMVALPFNLAAQAYALPARLEALPVNTYLYLSIVPVGAPPDLALRALHEVDRVAPRLVRGLMDKAAAGLTRRYMRRMEPALAQLHKLWEQTWWPEVQRHLAYWEGFDLPGAAPGPLLAHLDESINRLSRAWEIHWQLVLPSFLALGLFAELYEEHLGKEDAFGPYRLLHGADNMFSESDRALWQLSRLALTLPHVRQALEQCRPGQVIPLLQGSPEGDIFLAELRRYLSRYGQRGQRSDGLSEASLADNPTLAIKTLQDYARQPDRDMEAEARIRMMEREQWVARARERLQHHPPPVVRRFEMLLGGAQAAAFLHEEHNYWIDQRCQAQVRRVFFECGRRLAEAGAIADPGDVFFLAIGELRGALAQPAATDWRALVRQRLAEMARYGAVSPPAAIGRMPWMDPPDDPFGRSLNKVFGGSPMPTLRPTGFSAEEDQVRGNAASPGVVRGRARIVRSLAEASRLQPGEVLVTEATLPPWTPLLAIASAVVTDLGGVLSHAAVVAREYRIPAVVGTRTATAMLADGEMLEVDGDAGLVRRLPGWPAAPQD